MCLCVVPSPWTWLRAPAEQQKWCWVRSRLGDEKPCSFGFPTLGFLLQKQVAVWCWTTVTPPGWTTVTPPETQGDYEERPCERYSHQPKLSQPSELKCQMWVKKTSHSSSHPLQPTLGCNLLRDPKNWLAESSEPTEFWERRVNCNFKPLSLGALVLYHVATITGIFIHWKNGNILSLLDYVPPVTSWKG